MNDQKKLWDRLHTEGKVDFTSKDPTSFAKEVQSIISLSSYILDLGCGVGNDSFYFAQRGHKVLATDFSRVAIEKAKKLFKRDNLQFEVLDMSKPVKFNDNTFDVVYARLSLLYFTDKVTKEIFKEISRVLKKGGLLCFLSRSVKDSLYKQGKKIEKDMYELDGHVRHFFSENYVREYLKNLFEIHSLEEGEDIFYGKTSVFIKIIAQNKF